MCQLAIEPSSSRLKKRNFALTTGWPFTTARPSAGDDLSRRLCPVTSVGFDGSPPRPPSDFPARATNESKLDFADVSGHVAVALDDAAVQLDPGDDAGDAGFAGIRLRLAEDRARRTRRRHWSRWALVGVQQPAERGVSQRTWCASGRR